MEFHPYEALDNNQSQRKLWDWLNDAFKDENGVAYYRYPIFAKTGSSYREPDIVALFQNFGLWVFECKGCYINNIRAIQGHEWQMNDWYNEYITPVAQAEDQMFVIKNRLDERRESRGKVICHFRVALPNIQRAEWQENGFDKLPSTGNRVLIYEDLTPAKLKNHIIENSEKSSLSDQDWELVKGVLGGTLPSKEPRQIPTGTPTNNPIRIIHHIESKLRILDEDQQKIAFEVPDGPQRFRGLAGTGKTVLLAKRAVKMHIKHPEWTIGFVFFTRSLYDQILGLIATYHREMHPNHIDPDWSKIKVLHSWGGNQQAGFYAILARRSGARYRNVNHVINEIGQCSPSRAFEYVCECLNEEAREIPILYDALLIDEGQDLPPIFYQLAYKTLAEPYRLYWAYDEAQGIGSLLVPEPKKIFGKDSNGELIVNLQGKYKGGISKGHRMKKCYRTPRLLLMAAHAINMGLFRKDGALQGVTTKDEWNILGYDVTHGDFKSVGKPITINRPDSVSPHPIDQPDFKLKDALGYTLVYQTFESESQEQTWIAKSIAHDIQQGFDPWDIMITALSGENEANYFKKLKEALEKEDVRGFIAGTDGSPSIFRRDGCVTISNIFRAKGNEAWKVYACRFQYANKPLEWKNEDELHKRNEAFVALTRSRVWCVITGINSSIFDELNKAIDLYPDFTFLSFNEKSLRRIMKDDQEGDEKNN